MEIAKKKNYINNSDFEKLILNYRKTKDRKLLNDLVRIFTKIAESVYMIAVRNIYNNITPGNFPLPNAHDKEDLIQQAIHDCLVAIDYWQPRHKIKKIKSKAFNYFTCCVVYAIQNELKKELRKGWYKSRVLSAKYLINYMNKFGGEFYIDYDEKKKSEDGNGGDYY
jgi:hypothetical protein